MVPAELKRELLDSVGARMIVLQMGDARHLLAVSDMPPAIDENADLRSYSAWNSIMAALETLVAPPGRIIDVKGPAPMGADFIEIAMDEAPLKAAMRDYSENILLVSLFISAIVAICAALAIHMMVLRPVRRLTSNLMAFAERPEDASRIIVPSRRTHEIGQAEKALAAMESALARELKEKKHLAALGSGRRQDQPRAAQHARLRAIAFRSSRRSRRSAGEKIGTEAHRNARPGDPFLPGDARLWPRRRGRAEEAARLTACIGGRSDRGRSAGAKRR